jgi:hypothetical protein
VTLACALLLANGGAPDTTYMNLGQFKFPITILPERRAEIRELLLYVSRDKGQTWAVEARATPDQLSFPFYAAADGSYWFIVAIIDRQGRQDPVDVYQARVGQRIVVDTRKPEIQITRAERRGDDVQLQWDIREENPDLATLRLEYRSAEVPGAPWMAVNVAPAVQGETSFRPAANGPVQVRIVLEDLARNVGQATKDVAAATTTAAMPPEPVGSIPVAPPVGGGIGPVDPPPPPQGTTVGEYRPLGAGDAAARQSNRQPEEAPGIRPPVPQPGFVPPPCPAPLTQTDVGRPPSQSINPGQFSPPPLAQSDMSRSAIQPTSASGARDWSASGAAQNSPMGHGGLPAVEIVNKARAKLDFQVGRYGPSGLGSVDVYVTTDDGATWTLSRGDREVSLPTPAELHGGAPAAGSVTVELSQEGVIHGYYVVVKSRAGLGKKPPESGTPPQVRIEEDVTPPSVLMYKPIADPNRRDALLMTWKATDKNPANNPVTIEWAEQKDGLWKVIGAPQMANSGQYSWQVPADVPPSVYLRISVRDLAGNVAVAQTEEPVLVDLSVPETVSLRVSK